MQLTTALAVGRHLHDARMSPYLAAANGDQALALEIYLWNVRVAGAMLETLSITEVVFRNAVDRALRVWNVQQASHFTEAWTTATAAPLNGLVRKAVGVARNQASDARARRPATHPRKRAEVSHDDIVSQLSFGTFARLLPTADQTHATFVQRQILWKDALSAAFSGRAGDSWELQSERVTRLLALRNRAAHSEPLLEVNLKARTRDMVRLVQSIDPLLAGWLSGTTRIPDVARTRPRVQSRAGGG